jgi:hypothetical protein
MLGLAGMGHPASINSEQLSHTDMVAAAASLGSSGAATGGRGEQAIAAAAAAAAAASGVTLSVLVSAAINLPLVPG